MCGRYYIAPEDEPMKELIAHVTNSAELKLGEIFPTDHAPVIIPHGEVVSAFWGFPKFDGKGEIINARSETAEEKRTFRYAFQNARCLIPASCYYEWQNDNGRKKRYTFSLPDDNIIYLGGISQTDMETGEKRFVILTR